MSTELFSRPLEGCDAIQLQISDAADAGGSLPAEVQAHLSGCENCARFAATWFPGPPAVLTGPVAIETVTNVMRARILDAQASSGNIVRFPSSARPAGPTAVAWLGRVAACVAFVGFAYWLLNPALSPVSEQRTPTAAPSIAQAVTHLEDQRRAEGEVLHSAAVEGGSQVQHAAQWSMSSLEL